MGTRLVPWVPIHEQDWTILTVSVERSTNDDVRDFVDKRLVELAEGFSGRYSKFINTRWKALIALECDSDVMAVKLACWMPVERHILQSNDAKRVRDYLDSFPTENYPLLAYDFLSQMSLALKLPFHFVDKVSNAYNQYRLAKRRKMKRQRCKKNSPKMT